MPGDFGSGNDDTKWDMPPPGSGIGDRRTDEYVRLLSNRRRRYVLEHLATTDGAVRFDELVDQVVRWERETDTDWPETHRRDVAVDLHHHHLPKLVDHAAIDFDWRTDTIRYLGDDTLDRWLAVVIDERSGSVQE